MPDLIEPSSPAAPPVHRGYLPEHQLTRLIGLSFDGAASPSFTLQALAHSEGRDQPYGWGFAWYPDESPCALVVKDPTSIGENAMTKLLREWERFESTVFLCHLRGAARTIQGQDTHPFCRSHAGRDWVFGHNGDLLGDLEQTLPLGGPIPVFEPIGRTDSERAFCWLLTRVREHGARSLGEVGWERLHGWLRELDALGTANFMISDGTDLVIYHDEERYNGLCWTRLIPPHAPTLAAADIVLDLGDAGDENRSVVIFSTVPLEGASWTSMQPGELIVVRHGALVWDSHADETTRSLMIAPPPGVPYNVLEPAPSLRGVPQREKAMQVAGGSVDAPQVTQQSLTIPPEPMVPYAPFQSNIVEGAPQDRPSSNGGGAPAPVLPSVPGLALPPGVATIPGTRVLSVVHETVYRYDTPVERSTHLYRLRPVHDLAQQVLAAEVSVSVGELRRDYEDVFGNMATRTEVQRPYSELRILARSIVRVSKATDLDMASPVRRVTIPLVWMPWQRQMMLPYLLPPELPETQLSELYTFAMTFVKRQDHDLIHTLFDINNTIYRDFRYVSGSTTFETTPFDVYINRKGVCQDFSNLFICIARLLSIPARYRVGYIYTGGDYENKIQSEASHAWVEVYLPWRGWVGFDPTNGCLAGLDHVRIACGRNYRDATPTSGTIYKGGGRETLRVQVAVENVT
jgi:transglutaminase-like putative cysteine protease/predicted glutamine amidotransferase